METEIQKIKEFLKSKGWTCEEQDNSSVYKKSIHKGFRSQTIVNGQLINAEPNVINYSIIEIGEGDIDGTPIYGYNIYIDDESKLTVYVYDLQDFIKEIYSTIE